MATATKVKVRKADIAAIRERAKRDNSPRWDGHESWSTQEYSQKWHEAMKYYNENSSPKDLKPNVIDWMAKNGYSKKDIAKFKASKDWRCSITLGAIVTCLMRGMPSQRDDFNRGKDVIHWVRESISNVLKTVGSVDDTEEKPESTIVKQATVQDYISEQCSEICQEFDEAIDKWIINPDEFNHREFSVINLLKGKGTKASHARMIKGFYSLEYQNLKEYISGEGDEQLKEAYGHVSRKNAKKLIDFFESINTACDQIAAESKVLRKPRVKKVKPAEEIVKGMKFKISDDKLGIASVPATSLLGATMAVVYNTKTRKIGFYLSKTSEGLCVKGTSIINFTESSFQKTLRKPDVQLKEFKEQNTQKRFQTWFEKIKSTEIKQNGRINGDIVILKIFK